MRRAPDFDREQGFVEKMPRHVVSDDELVAGGLYNETGQRFTPLRRMHVKLPPVAVT